MFQSTIRRLAAGAIALGAFAATPAFAGQCPADQLRANPLTDRATAPREVTDDLIGSIDLGAEIGVAGRDLRGGGPAPHDQVPGCVRLRRGVRRGRDLQGRFGQVRSHLQAGVGQDQARGRGGHHGACEAPGCRRGRARG